MNQCEIDLLLSSPARIKSRMTTGRFQRLLGFDLIEKNVHDPALPEGRNLLKRKLGQMSGKPRPCKCKVKYGKKCFTNCGNKMNGTECLESCDNGDGSCQNRGISRGIVKKMRLVPRGAAGFGVIANEYIAAGEFICEYLGVIYELMGNPYLGSSHYTCGIAEKRNNDDESSVVVEAFKKGNISRYLSHSHSPNAQAVTKRVGSEFRHGIFALKPIVPGAEITFNYGVGFRNLGIDVCSCNDLVECPDVFIHSQAQIAENEATDKHRLIPQGTLKDHEPSTTNEARDPNPLPNQPPVVSIPLSKIKRKPSTDTTAQNQ